jgi:hypothetical protein
LLGASLEHYFEELAKLAVSGRHPEPAAIAALRRRCNTDQHTVLQNQ